MGTEEACHHGSIHYKHKFQQQPSFPVKNIICILSLNNCTPESCEQLACILAAVASCFLNSDMYSFQLSFYFSYLQLPGCFLSHIIHVNNHYSVHIMSNAWCWRNSKGFLVIGVGQNIHLLPSIKHHCIQTLPVFILCSHPPLKDNNQINTIH